MDGFDEMVRDFTAVGFMSKSEARERFSKILETETNAAYERGRVFQRKEDIRILKTMPSYWIDRIVRTFNNLSL